MKKRSTHHATFVIERTYDASPARVFAAWAEPAAKAQWFPKAEKFDFRIGGHELNRGKAPDGAFTATTLATRTSYPISGSSIAM